MTTVPVNQMWASQEPSGRKEIKQCISVQKDLQYVCRVDVFVQPDPFGTTAMRTATVVESSAERPAYRQVCDQHKTRVIV